MFKRRALVIDLKAAARREALRGMSRAYKQAYDVSRENQAGDAYPLSNQIAADVILSWRGTPPNDVAAALDELRRLASSLAGTRTDTFSLTAAGRLPAARRAASPQLDEPTRVAIAQAFATGAVARREHEGQGVDRVAVPFLRSPGATELPKEDRARLIEQLTLLEKQVLG